MMGRDEIAERNPDAIVLEPETFDVAILGLGVRCGMEPVVVYSVPKLLQVMMVDNSWDFAEACEWFEFNVLGAYMGEHTPIYLDTELDIRAVGALNEPGEGVGSMEGEKDGSA